jgi:hypothetical protein
MKYDVHRPPHEYQRVVPYPLQRGCTDEGCVMHFGDIARRCGLGTPWPGAPGTGSWFHCQVLF